MEKEINLVDSGRYQLRKAAGLYWLIDCKQSGVPYKRPVVMNETGAWIWNLILQGKNMKEIGQAVSRKYEEELQTAQEDTEQFVKQLRAQGVDL